MLPARTDVAQDQALQGALDRLTGGAADRPDAPDGWVTAVRRLPAQSARCRPYPEGVDTGLTEVLRERGITQPYTHQAEAIAHALAGRHVVVTTPTASGKTLCYNVPVLNAVLHNPASRALYLFPTKALAQDQLAELYELSDRLSQRAETPIGVHTYDGDTPQDARRSIRGRAHVVLTNADMLHSGILPHHPRWAKLFENLRYVVIDELHAYRGVFGSHLTNVLRRLHRICAHYGSQPTFICSSATIANPRELAERLVEQPFELVDESGAPRGEKFFIFVNPPIVNRQLGIRRSYLAETRRIAAEFLKRRLQLIVFAQSRLTTEILTTYLKDDFETAPPGRKRVDEGATDLAPKVPAHSHSEQIRGYRGGYLPQRRREIEKGLRDGVVRAVVATNALELGIDIGALDVCVMAGYPGTIASTWQRAGRAGRRSGRSAAVLVASSAPLDQFVVRHPAYFFDASPEHALINPDNLHILLEHVKCAAFELPFSTHEQFGRYSVQDVLGVLQENGFVHRAENDDTFTWTSESYPADAVSLRSISSDNFVIVDTTRGADVIAETSFTSGPSTLHEKAIYLIEGSLYQVEKLDFEGRKAYVRQIECDYYTDAITYTKVTILDTFATAGSGADAALPPPVTGAHGEVHVASRVVGFKKIKFYTNENVGSGDLDLPEQEMHTTAFWLTLSRELVGALPFASDDRRDGVVGLSFAMRQVAQLLLMCDRNDIGVSIGNGDEQEGLSNGPREGSPHISEGGPERPHTEMTRAGYPVTLSEEPRIFIYDNYPGGIGFSEPLFGMQTELLERTHALIAGCGCEHGCPTCVGPIGDIGPFAKTVALRILELAGCERAIRFDETGTDASPTAASGLMR
jgi:DEAD/DEAH box helicase domain-containing protein